MSDVGDNQTVRYLIELAERQGKNVDRIADVVERQGANFAALENAVLAQQGIIATLASSVHELAETVRRFFEGRTNGDT